MQRRAGLQALQFWRQTNLHGLGACFASKPSVFPDPSDAWNASNPSEDGEIGIVGGGTEAIFGRVAHIYAPARTASQQGQGKTATLQAKGPAWKIEFEVQQKWQNRLIGWTSTADPLENVGRAALSFNTKEEAIAFAKKNGFDPVVREPQVRRPDRQKRFMSYGDNYSVKRHGYPIGGMRSESPMKKQAATEEMAPDPPEQKAAAPEAEADAKPAKKASTKRAKKKDA